MQAFARVNRVNEGKNNGLIVDYCGILKHLRKVLATSIGTKPEGEGGKIDPARPDEELLVDLAEAILLVRAFLEDQEGSLDDLIQKAGFERNGAIVACKESANENDETRKRFEVMCREVFKKFKACINVEGGTPIGRTGTRSIVSIRACSRTSTRLTSAISFASCMRLRMRRLKLTQGYYW
jgi:type I restriction enzyme, R subunit